MAAFPHSHFYPGQRTALPIVDDQRGHLRLVQHQKGHDWCKHSFPSSASRLPALWCEAGERHGLGVLVLQYPAQGKVSSKWYFLACFGPLL